MKQKTERRASAEWQMAFRWQNFAGVAVAVALIVTGFVLMLPSVDVRNTVGGRYAPSPGPGAFDSRRIRVAPLPCVAGFVLMVPAILYVPRSREKASTEAAEM